MAVKPLWTSPPQFVDANGDPYVSARLFFYAAGSSTKQNVYTDDSGGTAASNPTTLNSSGYPVASGNIFTPWGTVGQTYKIVLAPPGSDDPPNSTIWTADDIAPINDTVITQDQWVSGPTPTFISTTSFSLVGDQTSTFHVGRRVKTTNSGGTIYSTIKASAFTVLTTITVVNDSGVLDSGLSAVSYGLLSATNPSTPLLTDDYPIVSGSADKTKKLRFEADGLTTDTIRVWTAQDRDLTVGPVLGTSTATTSGTSINGPAIASYVREFTLNFSGVSIDNTSDILIQLSDAGGPENSGYLGSGSTIAAATAATSQYTAGFGVRGTAAATVLHGSITFRMINAATFTWACSGVLSDSGAANSYLVSGTKSLTAALSGWTITTAGGTANFDAGAINTITS